MSGPLKIGSTDIRMEIEVELLLLHVERSKLRYFRHLIRMPPVHPPLEVFQASPTGRRRGVDPEHAGEITYFFYLGDASGFP